MVGLCIYQLLANGIDPFAKEENTKINSASTIDIELKKIETQYNKEAELRKIRVEETLLVERQRLEEARVFSDMASKRIEASISESDKLYALMRDELQLEFLKVRADKTDQLCLELDSIKSKLDLMEAKMSDIQPQISDIFGNGDDNQVQYVSAKGGQ